MASPATVVEEEEREETPPFRQGPQPPPPRATAAVLDDRVVAVPRKALRTGTDGTSSTASASSGSDEPELDAARGSPASAERLLSVNAATRETAPPIPEQVPVVDGDLHDEAVSMASSSALAPLQIRFTRAEQEQVLRETFLRRFPEGSVAGSSAAPGLLPTAPSFHSEEPPPALLLLITGPCGSGKTHLARSALDSLVAARGGCLIGGAFDAGNLQAPSPVPALAEALQEWARLAAARGPEARRDLRRTILEELGDDATGLVLLRHVVPGIAPILDSDDDDDDNNNNAVAAPSPKPGLCSAGGAACAAMSRTRDAVQRFTHVLTNFLRAICAPDRPLVLVMEDLHYADPCSIDKLTGVVTSIPGLLLVGTCDDAEMSGRSYLAQALREMEDQPESSLVHVNIGNLDESDVIRLVEETLPSSSHPEHATALGHLVFEQTRGNMFYISSFLHWLVQTELLEYFESAQMWKWDLEDIRLSLPSTNTGVIEFLSNRMFDLLPTDMKEVLKVAACLGSRFDSRLVELALGESVTSILRKARQMGILAGDGTLGSHAFVHEYVQLAAYRLIPEPDLALFHLEIGRRIWRNIPPCGLNRHLFTILGQIRHGKHLVTREKERLAVANLCLSAGTTAARTSTFRTSACYLELGVSMLEDRSWRDEYDLTLALYNFTAEVQMSVANFERMEELVNTIVARARRLQDKIPAYCTQLYALSAQGEGDKALQMGIDVLAGLGENFPARLCGYQLHKLYCKVMRLLKGKSNEIILRMPIMDDPEKLASLQLLHLMFLTALIERPKFTPFIVLSMMDITLRHGLSAFSSLAFAFFGMVCLQYTSDAPTAFRYGELGLELLDRFQAEEFIPRVHCAFYGCIYPRRKPLQDTLEYLWNAHLIGLRTGDINAAFLASSLWAINAFESDVPLPVIERRLKKSREMMTLHRQTTQLAIVQPHIETVDFLMGLSDDPTQAELNMFEVINQPTVTTEFNVPFCRMQRCYFVNRFDAGRAVQDALLRRSHLLPPSFKVVAVHFMAAAAALGEARRGLSRRRNLRFARKIIQRFRRNFALHAPQNGLAMLYLLEAELHATEGRHEAAFVKYTAAIAMAEASGQLYMRGQAYECAARHCLSLGERQDALAYLVRAIDAYSVWGAARKVQSLETQLELEYRMSRPYVKQSSALPEEGPMMKPLHVPSYRISI